MLVKFVGAASRTIEGITYLPGQVADLSPLWAHALEQAGEVVPHEAPPSRERVAVADYGHRDPFRGKP